MLGKNGARRKSSEATMKDQSFLDVISRLNKNVPHKSLHHCSGAKEKTTPRKDQPALHAYKVDWRWKAEVYVSTVQEESIVPLELW